MSQAELKLGRNSPNSYSRVLPGWVGGPFLGSEKRGTVPSLGSFEGGGGVSGREEKGAPQMVEGMKGGGETLAPLRLQLA